MVNMVNVIMFLNNVWAVRTMLDCLFLIDHLKLADTVTSLFYFYIFIERTKLCSNLLCKHSDVGGCSTTTIMIQQPSHTQWRTDMNVRWSSISLTLIRMIPWRSELQKLVEAETQLKWDNTSRVSLSLEVLVMEI